MSTEKKNVYALFVAINAYKRKPLNGCINDATSLMQYLKDDPTLNLIPVMITDADAVKDNIVQKFKSHLGQATKDDVVLFYFSGHGVPEFADKTVWTEEQDGRLEGIACYFNDTKTDNFILLDKEIRYLMGQLWQKKQPNIVTIFDCCHSGDNTRDLYMEDKQEPKTRFLGKGVRGDEFFVFPQRTWDKFIFSDRFKPTDFAGKNVEQVLPSVPHLQMSSAESNQLATEDKGSGVFTAALLEVLKQTGGFLSYRDIHGRVLNRLRIAYSQRPKLYTPELSEDMKNQGFLCKNIADKGRFASLSFTEGDKQYRINRGTLDGVQSGKTTVAVEKGDKILRGVVNKVALDFSTVTFDNDTKIELGTKDYSVLLDNLATRQIKLFLDLEREAATNALKTIIINALDGMKTVAVMDTEATADYVLRANGTHLFITNPNDSFRPILKPIALNTTNPVVSLQTYLQQMASWHYLTELENTAADALPKTALKVEVFTFEKEGSEKPFAVSDTEGVMVNLEKSSDGSWGRTFKIKITNQTNDDLYVGAFIHGVGFGINKKYLLGDDVVLLEKGNSKWLRDEGKKSPTLIPFSREEHFYWYNWAKYTDIIKFVFSTQPFDNQAFKLDELALPFVPDGDRAVGVAKGIGDADDEEPVLRTWNAKNLVFNSINPDFNKVTSDDIDKMKSEAQTAYFANNLYK